MLLTPKFHTELKGEGVEYCWAHAEAFYRPLPVLQKERAWQLQAACEREHMSFKRIDEGERELRNSHHGQRLLFEHSITLKRRRSRGN